MQWLRLLSRFRRGPRRLSAPPVGRRCRPQLECLEDRLTPATTINVVGTVQDLIAALNLADNTPGPVTLVLPAHAVYTLNAVDNNVYGPNGLPVIDNDITIVGNGATIQRDTAPGTPTFRYFYVSGGLELLPGHLTLQDLTLSGGFALGGAGAAGAGGGLGAGGAIFNQGTLTLSGVTLHDNLALGGSGGNLTPSGGGGGGVGSDGDNLGPGGGFGGTFSGSALGGSGGFGKNGSGDSGGGGGFVPGAPGETAVFDSGSGGGLGGLGGMPARTSTCPAGPVGTVAAGAAPPSRRG